MDQQNEKSKKKEIPLADRILLTPTEAAAVFGIGRTKLYELLSAGELPAVRIGRAVRIPVEKLREWVSKRVSEGETSSDA